MSNNYQRIEVITGSARRRRWSAGEKLRTVEETFAMQADGDVVAASEIKRLRQRGREVER